MRLLLQSTLNVRLGLKTIDTHWVKVYNLILMWLLYWFLPHLPTTYSTSLSNKLVTFNIPRMILDSYPCPNCKTCSTLRLPNLNKWQHQLAMGSDQNPWRQPWLLSSIPSIQSISQHWLFHFQGQFLKISDLSHHLYATSMAELPSFVP